MHLLRRAAFRAAGAASTSFTSAPRSFTTATTPFLVRSKVQSAVSPAVFRRFASDEAKPVAEELESIRSTIESESSSEPLSESSSATDGVEAEAPPQQELVDRSEGESTWNDGARSNYSPREQYDTLRSRPDRVIVPGSGIYIGNLLFEATAADLEKEFAEFGVIKSSKLATDVRGLSKGFGYIEFETQEQARAAIEAKDQTMYEGRRLVVNYMAKTNRPQMESGPTKTLFIGNLAFEMSDADLNKLFRDIRNVLDVRVAIDRRTGQPRGFAHADFVDVESAKLGKEILHGKEVYGRRLRVDYSVVKERTIRGPRSPSP